MKFVLPKSWMLVLVVFGRHIDSSSSFDDAKENAEKSETVSSSSSSMEPLFKEWMTVFGKAYDSLNEQMLRLEVWMENDKLIKKHNANTKNTYTLGHNKFSDMTHGEFVDFFKLNMNRYSATTTTTTTTGAHLVAEYDTVAKTMAEQRRILSEIAPSLLQLPDYINWVQVGAVTPVKMQGGCGSCWAFSATGAIEGAKFLKTGELVALSEQNLIDCDHVDIGCIGGLMDNAFKFDKMNGGLCSEQDYPYEEWQNDECRTNCTPVPGSTVRAFIDVPEGDEMALLSAIAIQPVSVAVDAANIIFQFYKDGVINNDDCGRTGSVNHGVLAVGYGTDLETQEPYFLVKNSWGVDYGADGYLKIGRSPKNKLGVCSILSKLNSFPVLED